MKFSKIIALFILVLLSTKVFSVCVVTGAGNVCTGNAITLTYSTSGSAPGTISWQYSADGVSGWANVVNGTPSGITYSGTATISLVINVGAASPAGTYYYRASHQTGTNCGAPYTSAAVSINVIVSPTTANAGPDQTLATCATTTTLAGNSATNGVGSWTLISGTGTITAPGMPNTTITGLTPGIPSTFRWTISQAGCTSSSDDVIITSPAGANCWNYCTVSGTLATPGYVSNVTLNSINRNSNFDGYVNTGLTTFLYPSSTYDLSVTRFDEATYTLWTAAWIDWNNDGDFVDGGENVLAAASSFTAGSVTRTQSITVPAGAVPGSTVTMRVVMKYNLTPSGPCDAYNTYIDWEDYYIKIAATTGTCSDGILNNYETNVDCGGPNCAICGGTCYDGIQNQDETGIDCGGVCPLSCTPQPNISSTTSCAGAAQANIYPITCDQIGTTAYDLSGPNATFTSGSATNPVPMPTCGTAGTDDCWIHVNLESGVSQLQLQFTGGSMAMGTSTCYVAAYQGTCASLTYVGCQVAETFISSVYGIYNVLFSGLNDAEDVWLYMYNANGKSFNLTFNMVGSGTPPSNTSCAGSSTALGSACNLAAPGASFTTPGAAAVSCTGGSWGSNENTTFYSFTPTATAATLSITDIICNDGTSGQAQFGVWTSCAAIGTYGAGFLGCAVGTANLSLTGLTIGQTYYIAADGYAGDNCTWAFSGSGILLPVELTKLSAKVKDKIVKLEWETLSEKNNDYFTIERSLDAENFEYVATVKGAGNSNQVIKYTEYDNNPYKGLSYYRLKQTDFDGRFVYSRTVSVNNRESEFVIVPNPSTTENGFTIQNLVNSEPVNIVINDITGKVVFSNEFNTENGNIEIKQSLSPGIYLIKVINSDNVVSQKLVIN